MIQAMVESATKSQKSASAATTTDRISILPDPVLRLILSFLPTKHAVATCLLSKRWRPLWLSLPTLDFDDGSFLKNETFYFRFVQFVDAVLILRDLEPIERFRLNCRSFCQTSNINVWVNAAIKRNVQQLELSFPGFNVGLPSSIFICSTIRVLKLNGLTVNALSSVRLPSLKVLHLESVHFPDYECVAKLLSGCKRLEQLVLKSLVITDLCSSGNIEGLTQLLTADVPSLFIPLKALYNVEFLRLSGSVWTSCHDIPIFHNLTHMEFTCFVYDWDWLVRWFQNCPKLQVLVIHKNVPGFPPKGNKEERLMEPKFVPKCLSSHLKKFCLREYQGLECELQLARLIMKNARVLRTIAICSTSSSNANAKLQMIKKLSSCPRGSVNCRLLFN